MMTNLKVENLFQHPNNPRKNLGDLTELSESIKISGILQNLTVVPWTDDLEENDSNGGAYTVIIGHRRLAAAKLAGLEEVPCVIANMSEKEQIATMLLENMQRSDLTIYEQAGGFQMMLDFGDSVDYIATQTGFSESTVRRRVKLLDLDGDKFKASVDRGATLQDFTELEKIKDLTLRNSVLDEIGTTNFKWKLDSAIRQEKDAAKVAEIVAALEKFATQITETDDKSMMQSVKYYYSSSTNPAEIEVPSDAGSTKYYFAPLIYGSIQLLKDRIVADSEEIDAQMATQLAEKERMARLQERRKNLDDTTSRSYRLRVEFVKNNTATKKTARDVMEFAMRTFLSGGWSKDFDFDLFVEMMGIELDEDTDADELEFSAISEAFALKPERIFFIAAYCNESDSPNWRYYRNYDCVHEKNNNLDLIYDCLEKLGYQVSDEEKALRDGSHELFAIN